MQYEDKIKWLWRYRDSLREQVMIEMEIKRLQSDATHITPILSDVPARGGDGDKVPRAVEKIQAEKERLQRQVLDCLAVRREVQNAVETVENPVDREILRRRYILLQKFEEIACALPLDYRNVARRHKRAVEKIAL